MRIWRLLLTMITMTALLGLAPPSAQAVVPKGAFTLTSSASSVRVGDPLEVTMSLDTAGRSANLVQLDVTYPADRLQLLSFDSSSGAFTTTLIDNSVAGLVSVVLLVPTFGVPASGSNLLVAVMHFAALAPGTADVEPAGNTQFVDAGPVPYYWPTTRSGTAIVIGHPSRHEVGRLVPNALGTNVVHTVTIRGRGFSNSSQLSLSGTGIEVRNVRRVNATKLTTTFLIDPAAPSGFRDVTVSTAGKVSRCFSCFFVQAGDYVIATTPAAAVQGSSVALHVDGTFQAGPDWKISAGTGVKVTDVAVVPDDATNSLTATLSVSPSAAPGLRTLVLTNLDNFEILTCQNCLNVLPAPAPGPAAGGYSSGRANSSSKSP